MVGERIHHMSHMMQRFPEQTCNVSIVNGIVDMGAVAAKLDQAQVAEAFQLVRGGRRRDAGDRRKLADAMFPFGERIVVLDRCQPVKSVFLPCQGSRNVFRRQPAKGGESRYAILAVD